MYPGRWPSPKQGVQAFGQHSGENWKKKNSNTFFKTVELNAWVCYNGQDADWYIQFFSCRCQTECTVLCMLCFESNTDYTFCVCCWIQLTEKITVPYAQSQGLILWLRSSPSSSPLSSISSASRCATVANALVCHVTTTGMAAVSRVSAVQKVTEFSPSCDWQLNLANPRPPTNMTR